MHETHKNHFESVIIVFFMITKDDCHVLDSGITQIIILS